MSAFELTANRSPLEVVQRLQNMLAKSERKRNKRRCTSTTGRRITLRINKDQLAERFGSGITQGTILWNKDAVSMNDFFNAGLLVAGFYRKTSLLYFFYGNDEPDNCVSTFDFPIKDRTGFAQNNLEIYPDTRLRFIESAGIDCYVNCNPLDFYKRFGFPMLSKIRVDGSVMFPVGFLWDRRLQKRLGSMVWQKDVQNFTSDRAQVFPMFSDVQSSQQAKERGLKVIDERTEAWLRPWVHLPDLLSK